MDISQLHELFSKSDGVCTDSRSIVPNTIFFALKGSNFDGNKFAVQAIKEGCAWAVVDDPELDHEKCIQFPNALKALQDLANYHRNQLDIPFIGITGSNGKTTTKELLHAVLETTYHVTATKGNFNNHIGVPLTLLSIPNDCEIAIIEMGANRGGEIAFLCTIAEPTHGIVTNIGKAHLEGFGSIEVTAETKTGLYRSVLSKGGTLFVNIDDKYLSSYQNEGAAVTYSSMSSADVQGIANPSAATLTFEWKSSNYESPAVRTDLVGQYNLPNALAAIAIGRHFNVKPEKINQALESYVPENNRSQLKQTERNSLILDAYNANPSSMRLAIENFAQLNEDKFFIIGGMLELGDVSAQEHLDLANQLRSLGLSDGMLIGEQFEGLELPDFTVLKNASEALDELRQNPPSGKTILLKGSRGLALEKLVEAL